MCVVVFRRSVFIIGVTSFKDVCMCTIVTTQGLYYALLSFVFVFVFVLLVAIQIIWGRSRSTAI